MLGDRAWGSEETPMELTAQCSAALFFADLEHADSHDWLTCPSDPDAACLVGPHFTRMIQTTVK